MVLFDDKREELKMIRVVLDWIQQNTFLDFVILFVFSYVIEVSKIKVCPWTWVGKKIGSVINHDVIKRMDDLDKRIDDIEVHLEEDREERQKERADSSRNHIIRGADEIRMEVRHSKEFFDNILRDCSDYKNYCKEHPKYENDKATFSMQLIEKTYQKCLEENSFL